ncbi:ester cyclase [Tsuneonella sp. HG094]
MNLKHVTRWINSFSRSADEAVDYYADEFEFADYPLEQFIRNDKAALRRAFLPFANRDPSSGFGIHQFSVDEYIGNENAGLVLFSWKATHCGAFFGLPVKDEREIATNGMTYHIYRDGKIAREIVHSDQIHVVQQLGYPVDIPHFWEDPNFGQ